MRRRRRCRRCRARGSPGACPEMKVPLAGIWRRWFQTPPAPALWMAARSTGVVPGSPPTLAKEER